MPIIYLSPSTQDWNYYITGGTEEYYMNLIADAMIPFLQSNGIRFVRNSPTMTAASSIQESNAGKYDLHVALHSNAAPDGEAGLRQGVEVYYSPNSYYSRRAAEIIAENLKSIYPIPSRVRALPTTRLGEVTKTYAPAVLIEFAYHDNVEDAQWIINHIDLIAQNVVLSLTEYFGLPFIWPTAPWVGRVATSGGRLNIRSRPSPNAQVIGQAENGQQIVIYGQWQDWFVAEVNGLIGFVNATYVAG